VAAQADLGKASLFHHFSTKSQLYGAVMCRVLDTVHDALVRSLAEGGTPTERLERLSDAAIDVIASNRSYPRLLIRALVEDSQLPPAAGEGKGAIDALNRIGTSVARLLDEGMRVGEFRRGSTGHYLLSIVGIIVHPLATGRFGEALLKGPLFDPEQIELQKRTVREILRSGIVEPVPVLAGIELGAPS
jgi:AcrR family transcriptional regulator